MIAVNSVPQPANSVAFAGIKRQATTTGNSGSQVAGLSAGMPAVPMAYFTKNISFKGLNADGKGTVNGYEIKPEASLYGANLEGAKLRGAKLRKADLREADLSNANLEGAILTMARLTGANLTEADLRNADLCNTDLRKARLEGANLIGACLTGADLEGAFLEGARFKKDDLEQLTEDSEKYISNNYKIMSIGETNNETNKTYILLSKDAEELKIHRSKFPFWS